jgi:acyl carrier protein
MDRIATTLKQIMSEIFRITESEITENSSMETIKSWDSLQHLNLMLAVEEHFDIKLDADEIPKATSFSILYNLITKKQSGK